jgi:hypothetical protein
VRHVAFRRINERESIGRPLARRGGTASSMTCMMRATPAMTEAGSPGDSVVDQLRGFRDTGHAKPRRR